MDYAAGKLGITVGTVGAYLGSGESADIEWVRSVRAVTGRVTVSGTKGIKVLSLLAKDGDLAEVDLDPADYLTPPSAQDCLFDVDPAQHQRQLGLSVVRSRGAAVAKADLAALRAAMTEPIGNGVTRVLSLHRSWLSPPHLPSLLSAVKACDDPLAIVLADQFDPLMTNRSVEGYVQLVTEAIRGGRPVEQLRTDVAAIPFAALGGSLGSIGLSTSSRHHGLPLSPGQQESYWERQVSPLVFVPALLSWQRIQDLAALEPWDGAGLTDCDCTHCSGRNLLRFDALWTGRVPADVRRDVARHDLASWSALAAGVLAADDPFAAWTWSCSRAEQQAAQIASEFRVKITVPRSIRQWARMGS